MTKDKSRCWKIYGVTKGPFGKRSSEVYVLGRGQTGGKREREKKE